MKKIVLILVFLAISSSVHAVNLRWDDNSVWPSQGVIGFNVYFENSLTGQVQSVSVPYPNTSVTIPDSNFARDIDYSFWATAYNSSKESDPSNTVTSKLAWDGTWGGTGGTAPKPTAPALYLSTEPGSFQIPLSAIKNE